MIAMIDPHAHSWDACWGCYCIQRVECLDAAKTVRGRLRMLEAEFGSKLVTSGFATSKEWAEDRMRILAINIVAVQRLMGSLRDYIEFCRVVHGRRDRIEFHIVEQAQIAGTDTAKARDAYREFVRTHNRKEVI